MITVKDIREKEFSKQKHGYHEDEVDDFLDEIADQMEELIRENRSLLTQLDDARSEAEAAASAAAAVPVERPAPPVAVAPAETGNKAEHAAVDEPSYFKNLETTLRETLLSAQRIADSTVAEARNKAKDLVSGAEEQAKQLLNGAHDKATRITQEANSAAQTARAELENLRKSHEDYKGRIMLMIREQIAALKLDEDAVGIKNMRKPAGAKPDPAAPEADVKPQPEPDTIGE